MTEKEKIKFIKNKLAPLFDGMNAKDILNILRDTCTLVDAVFSKFTFSLGQKKA